MEIVVFGQQDGLNGGPEVWVRVQADELLDWPRVKDKLGAADAATLQLCHPLPVSYHPSLLEGGDTGYKYEDWWIFKPLPDAKVATDGSH